jgi:uncharacterized protein YbcI
VIVDQDAIYSVEDPHDRTAGDLLRFSGATGQQVVASASGSDDLRVFLDSTRAEATLIQINPASHRVPPPDGPAESSAGGSLNAAITNLVVRKLAEYVGHGPTKAHTFFRQNVIVVIMENTMTRGERNLVLDGMGEAVLEMKRKVQLGMRSELISAIEGLTDSKVIGFISGNHLDPDYAAEIFILDGPVLARASSPTGRSR